MTGTQPTLLDDLEYHARELQDAQHLRDRRPILAHRVGDLLMREAEFLGQAPIAARLLHCIEVGALEVLHERQREQRPIIYLAYDRRDLRPSQARRRAQAPLARDELEALAARTHRDGLQKTRRLERRLELGEIRFLELASRLIRVRSDGRYLESLVLGGRRCRRGRRDRGGARDQRFESASE